MADGDQKNLGIVVADNTTTTTTSPYESTFCRYTPPNNTSSMVRGVVIGQEDNTANLMIGIELLAAINVASSVVTVRETKSPTSMTLDPQSQAWTAVFEADGDDVVIKVTGDAGDTVIWAGYIEVIQIEETI